MTNNLSLDDQKKLAIAKVAYPDVLWLPSNDNGWGYKAGYTWTEFNPKSPDTLMRLCFELRIGVTPHTGRSNGWMIKFARESYPAISYVYHAKTPEQIADGIIECSLAVINER